MTKEDLKTKIELVKALKCSGDCSTCSKNYTQCLLDLRALVSILFKLLYKKNAEKNIEAIKSNKMVI